MNSTIGSRIRDRRKELGMSQEELAEKLFTSKQMISAYENDKTEIRVSVLRELVVALDTSTSFLVDGKYDSFYTEDLRELIELYKSLGSDSLRVVALRQMHCLLGINNFLKYYCKKGHAMLLYYCKKGRTMKIKYRR